MGMCTRDLRQVSTADKRNRVPHKPLTAKPGGAKAFIKRTLRREERNTAMKAIAEDWGEDDILVSTPVAVEPNPFVYDEANDLEWFLDDRDLGYLDDRDLDGVSFG